MATDVKSIKVHDDCLMILNDLMIEHKYRYMIISFSKVLKYIKVEKTAPQEKTYDHLLNDLSKHDISYAIYIILSSFVLLLSTNFFFLICKFT